MNFEAKEPINQKINRFIYVLVYDFKYFYHIDKKIKYLIFYLKNGWDCRDVWNLDYSFSKYILPILLNWNFDYLYKNSNRVDFFLDIIFSFYMVEKDLFVWEENIHTKFVHGMKNFKVLMLEEKEFSKKISEWWYKRLEYYIQNIKSHPGRLNKHYSDFDDGLNAWKRILNKIKYSFHLLGRDRNSLTKDEIRELKKGLSYFVTYYRTLWD